TQARRSRGCGRNQASAAPGSRHPAATSSLDLLRSGLKLSVQKVGCCLERATDHMRCSPKALWRGTVAIDPARFVPVPGGARRVPAVARNEEDISGRAAKG